MISAVALAFAVFFCTPLAAGVIALLPQRLLGQALRSSLGVI